VRILFCSPIPTLDPRLGASRVIVDLTEAWRGHGWDCDIFPEKQNNYKFENYPDVLAEYLSRRAEHYDVVDYPYTVKPWIKSNHGSVLKVARVVLLAEHLEEIPDPLPPKAFRMSLFKRSNSPSPLSSKLEQRMRFSAEVMARSNLITVANRDDSSCLVRRGIPQSKIKILPYGLTVSIQESLGKVNRIFPANPVIAFIGTFDYRKGCLDFPALAKLVLERAPNARFKLLGTQGLFPTARAVLKSFPAQIRERIEVRPNFQPAELPDLLTGCRLGVFPSYREGFGIAVVEMLAAGLPVVAYRVPGPRDILPDKWMAPRGNVNALADCLIKWLGYSDSEWAILSNVARQRAGLFDWSKIAMDTREIYHQALQAMNKNSDPNND
jgi:glycosyltransferase involved in cell wall biosynthesis